MRLKEKEVPIFHTSTAEIMLDKALDEIENRCAVAEDKVQELEMQIEEQHQKIIDMVSNLKEEWAEVDNKKREGEEKRKMKMSKVE